MPWLGRTVAAALGAAAVVALPGVAGAAERPSPARAWAAWRAAPKAAAADSFLPGAPPAICQGDFWSDQIGTNEGDVLLADRRPERLWGRAGPDALFGSATRAACLMGGRDPDVLDLQQGGGASWGEHGSDLLVGSPLDDILDGGDGNDTIVGGDGSDAIKGGPGVDGIDAGPGDDLVDSADGRAEIVDCGPGADLAVADRVDVLLGCEVVNAGGRSPVRLTPSPGAARLSGLVRLRFRVPEAAAAGAYRVMLIPSSGTPGCATGPVTLTALPQPGRTVVAGQAVRVGLRPPAGGWCAGTVRAAVVLDRPCRAVRLCAAPPPGEPVARLSFVAV